MKFISIGDMCWGATILRNTKLRDESLPFDWLFTNIEYVTRCIEDDMDPLLTTMYKNRGKTSDDKFNNDNAFPNSSIPHYDCETIKDRTSMCRAMQRFWEILKSDEYICFICIDGRFDKPIDPSKLDAFEKVIRNKRKGAFEILNFHYKPSDKFLISREGRIVTIETPIVPTLGDWVASHGTKMVEVGTWIKKFSDNIQ